MVSMMCVRNTVMWQGTAQLHLLHPMLSCEIIRRCLDYTPQPSYTHVVTCSRNRWQNSNSLREWRPRPSLSWLVREPAVVCWRRGGHITALQGPDSPDFQRGGGVTVKMGRDSRIRFSCARTMTLNTCYWAWGVGLVKFGEGGNRGTLCTKINWHSSVGGVRVGAFMEGCGAGMLL